MDTGMMENRKSLGKLIRSVMKLKMEAKKKKTEEEKVMDEGGSQVMIGRKRKKARNFFTSYVKSSFDITRLISNYFFHY